ncbi:MAG: ComEC family competence protein [Candidatus Niyogibacteria bacterium]|nr:ComEC family competence protein [Candidatus Niyogibacteria bacterium]
MNFNVLALAIGGFLGGVFLRSFFAWPLSFTAFAAVLGVAMLFSAYFAEQKRVFFILGLVALSFCAGTMRYEVKDANILPPPLANSVSRQVLLRGMVSEEPDERENNTRLIFRAESVYEGSAWREISGEKILVYVKKYPELNYGDILEVAGTLKKPENFSDFDWENYLAKDDIFLEMFSPRIVLLGNGGSWVKEKLFALKRNFTDSLSRVLPEPHASFLAGLTIGAKKSMPPEVLEEFKKAGIMHLVVLSGYNITIIAENIGRMMKFLPLPFGAGLSVSVLGIIFFAIMTGASATIVRAAIMAILVLVARSTGRVYEVTVALLFAGFFMVLQNPKILRFDPSFQLSFLATLGLIFIAPRLEGHMGFLSEKWGLRENVSATLSAQIAVLPLVLYLIGNVSPFALPVNILILMFIPATMFFGFMTWAVGIFSYILSLPLAWIAWLFLNYELGVAHFFASLLGAGFMISDFSAWWLVAAYAGLATFVFMPQIRGWKNKRY